MLTESSQDDYIQLENSLHVRADTTEDIVPPEATFRNMSTESAGGVQAGIIVDMSTFLRQNLIVRDAR